jgi:hypothetical protein
LEKRVLIADFRRGSHSEPSHDPRSQIGKYVAELVLHDENVVSRRILDHVQAHRVDVGRVGGNLGMFGRNFKKHLSEKCKAAKDVGLVDAGDPRTAVGPRLFSPRRNPERSVHHLSGAVAGDDERVGRRFVADQRSPAIRREQALQVFAQDDEVDSSRGVGQNAFDSRIQFDRADR